jgi:hypothetical protein
MPGYKGHLLGATITNTAYVGVLEVVPNDLLHGTGLALSDWQLLVALYVIGWLFGLWPDVDTNSKGQDIFFGIAFVADVLLILTGRLQPAAYLGLLAMTPIIGHHRGWTHSRIPMFLVPLPIVLLPYIYDKNLLKAGLLLYGAAFIGYFSHLLLDGKITKYVHFKGSSYSN